MTCITSHATHRYDNFIQGCVHLQFSAWSEGISGWSEGCQQSPHWLKLSCYLACGWYFPQLFTLGLHFSHSLALPACVPLRGLIGRLSHRETGRDISHAELIACGGVVGLMKCKAEAGFFDRVLLWGAQMPSTLVIRLLQLFHADCFCIYLSKRCSDTGLEDMHVSSYHWSRQTQPSW